MDRRDSIPIHQGYLTKSPPDSRIGPRIKRVIVNVGRNCGTAKRSRTTKRSQRMRYRRPTYVRWTYFRRNHTKPQRLLSDNWRKRWFVLRGDKSLEYYEERQGKLKKTIDLNLCTCLDKNLSHKMFGNIFSIKIDGNSDGKHIDRNYYLVAETPYEMDTWVDKICELCDFQKFEGGGVGPVSRHGKQKKETTTDHDDEMRKTRDRPDSGIHVNENNNTCDSLNYDMVPAPREIKEKVEQNDRSPPTNHKEIQSAYDMLPAPAQKTRLTPNSCPLDIAHDSKSDEECASYDNVPPPQPTYDVPPEQQPVYDIVPSTNRQDFDYDHVPQPRTHYQIPGPSNYDTLLPVPVPLSTYDIVPPPDTTVSPAHVPLSTYDVVPPPGTVASPGHVPLSTYDVVPPPDTTVSPGHEPSDTYDVVPPPVAVDEQPAYDIVPPPRDSPALNKRPYVNFTIGGNLYNKPLPRPPSDEYERDSGTVADFGSDDNCYDVPPRLSHEGERPPNVDRSKKPGASPPLVNRANKPAENTTKAYVNLGKSYTFREDRPAVRKSNVQRSRSSVGDRDIEGYLFMESPKRTHSSSRFSKKERDFNTSFNPEENGDEYVYMDRTSDCYENYQPQEQSTSVQRKDVNSDSYENCFQQELKHSNVDPTKQIIRGHYQDIDIISRPRGNMPVTSHHTKTNYTPIDLEKTKGLRKTREELNKK